jgi:Zn-dependent protease with chaperone function
MADQLDEVFRLPQISPRAYEHPGDRAATAALRSIPFLETAIQKLTEYSYERSLLQFYLGNSVRLGPDQLPDIWSSYLSVLDTLDMPQQYGLYISQTPFANAFTIGTKAPLIILNSGIVSLLEQNELRAVLAHEVGHVLSGHTVNSTALQIAMMLGRIAGLPMFVGLPVVAIRLILLEWFRVAELSADRAAVLAVRDPMVHCRVMMNLAGGAMSQHLNIDAFIRQSMEYEEWDSKYDRSMRLLQEIGRTHPFPVRRVAELMKWVRTGEYDRIIRGEYIRRGEEPAAPHDVGDGVKFYTERFQAILKEAGTSIQDVGRQVGDWLKGSKDKEKE